MPVRATNKSMNSKRDWKHQLAKTGGMLLLALLAIFSLQNLGMARIEFLVWSIEAPRGLIYVMLFLLGGLGGMLLRRRGCAKRSDADL